MYPFIIFQKIKICTGMPLCSWHYEQFNMPMRKKDNLNFLSWYFEYILQLLLQETTMISDTSPCNFPQTSKERSRGLQ